jgi:hypothetical protein
MRDNSTEALFKVLFLLLTLLLSSPALSAEPSPTARSEITHLLNYVELSGCKFYRNGTWHSTREARIHIEMKYRYLLKEDQVGTAEDFIERAAAKSTVSGRPYQVRCDHNTPVTAAEWFTAELLRHRKQQEAKKP